MTNLWVKIKVLTLSLCLFCTTWSFADVIPTPSGQKWIFFVSSDTPENGIDPSRIIPLGIGPIATGGNTLTLSVSLERFANPVDIYLGFVLPYSNSIKILTPEGSLQDISEGVVPWSSNVSQPVTRTLFQNLSTSSLPAGNYALYLLAAPAGGAPLGADYTMWESSFTNRDSSSEGYPYKFFAHFYIDESVQLSCPSKCATTVVPSITLNIEGEFEIVNNQVSGHGTTTVTQTAPCIIEELGGGGAGSSCTITGSTTGTFTISGYPTGVTSVTGYGFQPTVQLTFTENIPVDLKGTYYWVNPATGAVTQLPLAYYAGIFSELLEESGLYNTPFEIPTVVCDGWMTGALESEVSETFEGAITVPGGTGSMRYVEGGAQLFFYESPFHIAGDVSTENSDSE